MKCEVPGCSKAACYTFTAKEAGELWARRLEPGDEVHTCAGCAHLMHKGLDPAEQQPL